MPLDAAPAFPAPDLASTDGPDLLGAYVAARRRTMDLARSLSPEDQVAQSMPDASPVKWHLAHTTWFFETFVLQAYDPAYRAFDPAFGFLFNSYYEAAGARHPRPRRGLLTRPSAAAVLAYRAHVDAAMERLLAAPPAEAADLVSLGLAHEQQHQELILIDVLNLFAASPLDPAYAAAPVAAPRSRRPQTFVAFAEGLTRIGATSEAFAFDNERPRHPVFLAGFSLASRLVTNREWMAFMAADGYRRPEFWLSDGWALVQEQGWAAPLYWRCVEGRWMAMSLSGLAPVDPEAPVTHVSFHEAAAFAAFADARLPTEAEWEHAMAADPKAFEQVDDSAWQWTASPYGPYPGFAPAAGAVGEYNGKFMSGQMVLRGGAFVTPAGHARPTYRNFFYPHQRWMVSGVRLARDEAALDDRERFRAEVVAGLGAPRKRLAAKWFYDRAGSALFERICEQPEYYPTRQEIALLDEIADDLAARLPPGAVLVELGSGASIKTRRLLDARGDFSAYAPVDISASALEAGAGAIARDYPHLAVTPLVGDFTRPALLRSLSAPGPRVGFFPGSTIGNFEPARMVDLLAELRAFLGSRGLFIVGVDLVKAPAVLEAAYDDAAGITAAFNLNLLARINRDLEGDVDLTRFAHRAVWNAMEGRVEMHLEAIEDQSVSVAGRRFDFVAGETIHTENSYKLSLPAFEALARRAGWRTIATWVSPAPQFAIVLLGPSGGA